ncbi:MAG: hypothetical protein ABSG89_10280 [Bacteroidales bacterium]|jgi:hypothetical protein
MRRPILVILILCFAIPVSNAQLWMQRRWEVEGGIGPSFFFGDIGGYSRSKDILGFRDLNFLQTRFDVNGSLRFRITREINVRLSLSGGMFSASDSRGSNEDRKFAVSTTFFEPVVIGEYYFIKNYAESNYLFIKQKGGFSLNLFKSLDFYCFTGFGGLSYHVDGNAALAQHGYVKGGFTGVIPVGLGATLIYTPNINFGIEIGGRYPFTDYLDGYTSQYSTSNDVYYFLNFTVTYKLKSGRHGGFPSFRR